MAVDQIILELRAEAKQFKAELAQVKSQVEATEKRTLLAQNNMNKGFNQMSGSLKNLAGTIGLAFGVNEVLRFTKATIDAASNIQETTSKVGELFGASKREVLEWSKTTAQSIGQSQQQALDAASTFAIFGKSAGLSGDSLVKFSTDFTSLASDLASFNNTSPEEAIQAIGAALRGEAEPIRRYGVLLDEASIKQSAMRLGIIKTTKEALTPQQKVLAVQAEIYRQTTAAQGDFARTSDGLANQQRILSAEFANLQVIIGDNLLPIVLKMTTALNDLFRGNIVDAAVGWGEAIIKPFQDLFWAFNDLIGMTDAINEVFKLFGSIEEPAYSAGEAANFFAQALARGIKPAKELAGALGTTSDKGKVVGAFQALTEEVNKLNKEMLDNITLGEDTYKQQREILALRERINKIQFEANALLSEGIVLTGIATEVDKEYIAGLQKQPKTYKELAESYRAYAEIAFAESPEEARQRFIRDMEEIGDASSQLASALGQFGETLTQVFGKAAQDNAAFAGFLKGITILEITLSQAAAISQAIAKLASGDPLSVITGAISLVSSITALFGGIINQIEGIEVPTPPAFAEGTAYVGLNGNPKGVDTIPAYLNEGEAVIPTDRNKKYPGLASAWINNKLDDYIMSNWVAPAIEQERNRNFADNLAEAIKVSGVFDDYRLYRAISEQTSVNKSGFKKLDKVISRSVNPRLRYD